MQTLWTIAANPRKRKSRKARSPAQRAATRKMLAANRSRTGARPARKRKARRASSAVASPARRRVTRRTARRSMRRVSASFGGIKSSAIGLVKAGAIGAGGALAVDVAQGFINKYLPASMNSKTASDGAVNYTNYAIKGALAVALAHFGKRFLPAGVAAQAATGSMTVMIYELARPMVASALPSTMSLGWFSPGMTFAAGRRPGVGIGQYQNAQLGQYQNRSAVSAIRSPMAVTQNSRRA